MMNTETTTGDGLLAGLEDDWESASKHLSTFIDEAQQTLDEMIEALLALEGGGGHGNVERLFAATHRLKGSAASLGLNRTAKLAHLAEDLLQELVDQGRDLTPQAADTLLAFTDALRNCVDSLKQGRPEENQFDGVARDLLVARGTVQGGCRDVAPAEHPATTVAAGRRWSEAEIGEDLRRQVAAEVRENQRDAALIGKVIFEPELPLAGLKARLLYEKLSNLGDVFHFDPPAEDVENRERLDGVVFGVATEKSPQAVKRLLRQTGIQWLAIEPLVPGARASCPLPAAKTAVREDAAKTAGLQDEAETAALQKPAETLRVDVERLDQLMNFAAQLSIGQARLAEIGGRFKKVLAGHKPAKVLLANFVETIQMLDRVGDGIQQAALGMRMVPIGPLFARFHRAVRDITHANGKDIRLALSGESTELDKRMIDHLGDPLIHCAAQRSRSRHRIAGGSRRGGKAAAGHHFARRPSSRRQRRHPRVGRRPGAGRRSAAAKAVEMGLLSPSDAQGMTPRELYRLAWTPGLSTAQRLSEVSGRGMGMDIVRSTVENLNGSVELESAPGRGTTVVIKLPLTLAILPSMLAEMAGEVFAVPLESVVEIVEVGLRDVTTIRGRPAAVVRDRVVPIVTLDALFARLSRHTGRPTAVRQEDKHACLSPNTPTRSDRQESPSSSGENRVLVVLGSPDRQIGLAVDRVLGEEDVVVKSLAANYRNVAGLTGAGISGEGRVFLILDPPALIENIQEHNP